MPKQILDFQHIFRTFVTFLQLLFYEFDLMGGVLKVKNFKANTLFGH